MSYLSPKYLERFNGVAIEEALKKAYTADKARTFLSHATADRDELKAALALLLEHGADTFVAEREQELMGQYGPRCADILARKVHQSQRVVVIATQRSAASGWVSWELGLGHGVLGADNVAALPLTQNGVEEGWARLEYLGLYQVVRRTPAGEWVVDAAEGAGRIGLRRWLTGDSLPSTADMLREETLLKGSG